jgi:hypothetical protein
VRYQCRDHPDNNEQGYGKGGLEPEHQSRPRAGKRLSRFNFVSQLLRSQKL